MAKKQAPYLNRPKSAEAKPDALFSWFNIFFSAGMHNSTLCNGLVNFKVSRFMGRSGKWCDLK